MGGWEKDYITSIARTTGGVSVRFEMMKAARNNIGRSAPSGPLARTHTHMLSPSGEDHGEYVHVPHVESSIEHS